MDDAQVAAHRASEVGIDHSGGGALVLAEFGKNFVRHGDQVAGTAEALGDLFLMIWISEREEEANGNGFWFRLEDASQDAVYFAFGQSFDDCAVPCQPFVCADAVAGW